MHRTDKYSQHNSIIWPIWLNGRVFVYELSGCGFESRCSQEIYVFFTNNGNLMFFKISSNLKAIFLLISILLNEQCYDSINKYQKERS